MNINKIKIKTGLELPYKREINIKEDMSWKLNKMMMQKVEEIKRKWLNGKVKQRRIRTN